jgi:hypothetical protein
VLFVQAILAKCCVTGNYASGNPPAITVPPAIYAHSLRKMAEFWGQSQLVRSFDIIHESAHPLQKSFREHMEIEGEMPVCPEKQTSEPLDNLACVKNIFATAGSTGLSSV